MTKGRKGRIKDGNIQSDGWQRNLLSNVLVGGTVFSSSLFAAHQSGKVPDDLGEPASVPSLSARSLAAAQEEGRMEHPLSHRESTGNKWVVPLKGLRPASPEGKVKSRPAYVISQAAAAAGAAGAMEEAAVPHAATPEAEARVPEETLGHIRSGTLNAVSYRDLIRLCGHHGIAVEPVFGSHVQLTYTFPNGQTHKDFIVKLHGGRDTYGPRTLKNIQKFLESCGV